MEDVGSKEEGSRQGRGGEGGRAEKKEVWLAGEGGRSSGERERAAAQRERGGRKTNEWGEEESGVGRRVTGGEESHAVVSRVWCGFGSVWFFGL
jgi:hypothetical protein